MSPAEETLNAVARHGGTCQILSISSEDPGDSVGSASESVVLRLLPRLTGLSVAATPRSPSCLKTPRFNTPREGMRPREGVNGTETKAVTVNSSLLSVRRCSQVERGGGGTGGGRRGSGTLTVY